MKRNLIFLFIISLIILSCSEPKGNPKMNNSERITQELTSLLTRSNKDAFVIFEDKETRKYVQFSGSIREPLLLNLPAVALSSSELDRAKKIFAEYNIKLEKSPFGKYEGGPVTGYDYQFFMDLGKDINKASKISMRIFNEVYLLPNTFNLGVDAN